MTDWSSPAVTLQIHYALVCTMFGCIGIFAYDNVRYFGFDMSIVLGRRQRRWPQLPYLFSKVCMWTYLICCMFLLLSGTQINCFRLMQGIEAQMGWVAVSSSVLLAVRAVCVYTGKARTAVSIVLTIMTLGLLAAWMEGVSDIVVVWTPGAGYPWQEGICAIAHISRKYAIKYVVTIVFDLVVMILTIVGVVRMSGGSRIGQVLIKQGIQYFALTFLVNALVTGLTLTDVNPMLSIVAAIPSATVCVMCATRLYVNLAEEAHPKPLGVNSPQLSSSFNSEKIARFFKRSTHTQSESPPSFALKSASSWSNGGTGETLSYVAENGKHCAHDAKSYGMGSDDDLEAQAERHRPVVTITEERTVVEEPMPEHLIGTFSEDGAEGSDCSNKEIAKSRYPRLSKT